MAEKINDGGPVFPSEIGTISKGITLRDYFAATAMQAYFTDPHVAFCSDVIEAGSQAAYRIADAMLKARGQQ